MPPDNFLMPYMIQAGVPHRTIEITFGHRFLVEVEAHLPAIQEGLLYDVLGQVCIACSTPGEKAEPGVIGPEKVFYMGLVIRHPKAGYEI